MYNSSLPAKARLHVSDDAPLGGAIVFSTVVNVVRLRRTKLFNMLSQIIVTFWQRAFLRHKIQKILLYLNDNQVEQISNITILPQHGIYISPSGKRFREKSARLEIAGASKELLTKTGETVLLNFFQQSVMVICYDEGVKFHIHR